MKLTFKILAAGVVLFSIPGFGPPTDPREAEPSGPSKVEIRVTDGKYQLLVNGNPFYIKGAGLGYEGMESLARHGGNSFRTWSAEDGRKLLDGALKYGLMVCMGLEAGSERHGFDYNDEKAVAEQLERIREEVMLYRDHPALLMWGIGNELNLAYTNPAVWDAVNDIADMIHEIDPNHPVTTMLAGADREVLAQVMQRCPNLDLLAFQLYADIVNLPRYMNEYGYAGPYIVTEWGATGHWESPTTTWGRPIEQNSHDKASSYKVRYETVIAASTDRCLGSYVFLWGQKQERTPTWYGIFLENGEETEAVDVMHYEWNQKWPENRTPSLDSIRLNGKTAVESVELLPGGKIQARAWVTDPEGDRLAWRWEILREVDPDKQSYGGDFEPRPDIVMEFSGKKTTGTLTVDGPKETGEYRIFVYAGDGHGHAATANIPFLVR